MGRSSQEIGCPTGLVACHCNFYYFSQDGHWLHRNKIRYTNLFQIFCSVSMHFSYKVKTLKLSKSCLPKKLLCFDFYTSFPQQLYLMPAAAPCLIVMWMFVQRRALKSCIWNLWVFFIKLLDALLVRISEFSFLLLACNPQNINNTVKWKKKKKSESQDKIYTSPRNVNLCKNDNKNKTPPMSLSRNLELEWFGFCLAPHSINIYSKCKNCKSSK